MSLPATLLFKCHCCASRVDGLEEDIQKLQSEKEQLTEFNESALENRIISHESDALDFLLDKFPDLSKEGLAEHCIQLAAINENRVWTVYSLSDYFDRELSFSNI